MIVNGYQVTYKRDGRLRREFFDTLNAAETRVASHKANRRVAVSNPKRVKLTVANVG